MTKARKALGVLGRERVENDEDGDSAGGGEGRQSGDEVSVGGMGERNVETIVGGRGIDGGEEAADEFTAVLSRRKERKE
jgi:hypothetical protein